MNHNNTHGPESSSDKNPDVKSDLVISRRALVESAVNYFMTVIDQPTADSPMYPEQWSKQRYTAPNTLVASPTVEATVNYETKPTAYVVPEKETYDSNTSGLTEREITVAKARQQTAEAFLLPADVDKIYSDEPTPREWLELLGSQDD